MSEAASPNDALIVVDVQNDFCPGGALPVPAGDEVVPELNAWIAWARAGGALVVASRDWHPAHHCSFEPFGGRWPPHCIAGTPGAAFHPRLEIPDEAVIVSKATQPDRDAYSAFDGTGLETRLRERGVKRVLVGGLALDYCVKATALDAARAGFETVLLRSATRPVEVHPGDGERAVEELRAAGVRILDGRP
ncbi:MAG: nicotinamidase [Acidobacteria bacterium]|nr:MAG: nicotinamidase [Acidobacteriota bacterium]